MEFLGRRYAGFVMMVSHSTVRAMAVSRYRSMLACCLTLSKTFPIDGWAPADAIHIILGGSRIG
jgi:hypothetical protein